MTVRDCEVSERTVPKSTTVGDTVMLNIAPPTVSVKLCVAEPAPLEAVRLIPNVPAVDGMPLIVAVPLPLSVNVTPAGNAPVSEILGTGNPSAATVNELEELNTNVALPALVNTGD